MRKRLVLVQNSNIMICAQDKELGDAQAFVDSRSDTETLALIGAAGNSYTTEAVAKYMPEPSLEIGDKKIFAIVSAKDGRYLGDIRVVKNAEVGTYELGIVIIESERNKTFGSQAIILISEYAFKHLGVNSIVLRVYQNNPRAQRLYKRLGFRTFKTTDDGYTVSGKKYLENWMRLSK